MEKEVRLQLRSDEMISFLKKKIHSFISSIDVIVSTRDLAAWKVYPWMCTRSARARGGM